MLSDKELSDAANQLASFRVKDDEYHRNHAKILDKYAALMEDFKRLKSDFEEARDSRERYKSLAKGGERNPFVLVLVDGDGYVFDDDLLESKAEGGSRAAQLLNDTVQRSLRNRPGLENCNIMVRIYANVVGLSKAVSKVGLAGPEKRSLAPFVANFNRSNGLFDFVDAGELKENADFKIRGLFRQFVENTQCRHIYFAACHDVGYLSELTSYTSQRDRITLVRNYAFHKEYARLGLRTEEFPGIFRATALPSPSYTSGAADMPPPPTPSKPVTSPIPTAPRHASSASIDAEPCTFYQKGACKYGKGCKFAHVKVSSNGHMDSSDWRTPSKTDTFQTTPLSKSDNKFMTGNSSFASGTPDFTVLPREGSVPPNKTPVNARQERLDCYLPPISADDRAQYRARIARQKLCNSHHLNGYCPNGTDCQYDHSPISEGVKNCLQEVAHHAPCPRRQACRSLTCLAGHVCQRQDCQKRGGRTFCKFPFPMHNVDFNMAEYVQGTNAPQEENGSASGSAKESPTSYSSGGESPQADTQEGAPLGAVEAETVTLHTSA
ncbi:hypothetical protein M409DRAFT_26513 [Zasmidium cellare ATCC 36951]|uniref:C3H1-type domain-containing protein n=1 Tax=Zasmidium cellare ATCC 36951 TaxID=1080233 RepID=A0A6A6C7A4_ZASCE|nr:uncharacterized protein M409DRAFT_26513 [Zasmidium cellare ATCC 36951]KAF2163067.1 hypothetical protein M409DRAFT_26513 [Zasmidium cellare ATCC 36951]